MKFALPRPDESATAFGARCHSKAVPLAMFLELLKAVREERHRNNALEARLETLEQRPAVVYRGVWRSGEQYAEASIVTDNGSLWIAREESRGVRPGSNAAWQLIVKKGGA
jgi:hypothetical protein